MSDFISFEHDSGEILFVRRNAIDSFHPKYQHPKGYLVYVVVGQYEKPIFRCETKDEARKWCENQIRAMCDDE